MKATSFWNNTAVYGAGFLLLRGISFILLPIYTNLLPAYDTGIIFLIYTLLAFLNPVYAYGMNASLFKFYNDNQYSPVTTISTSLISVVVSSCFFSGLLVLFSPFLNPAINSSVPVNWFLWIALILLFDAVSARVFVVLRVQERPFYFLFISTINIFFSIVCNILFIKYLGLGSYGAVLSLVCVSSLQTLCLLPIVYNAVSWEKFNLKLFKSMLRFSLPFLPAALLFVVVGFSDRWFIKYYLDMESVGYYGAGYKIGSIMSLVVTAFNLNWQPYYLKTKKNTNNRFGAIGSVVIMGFISIFVLLLFFVDIIKAIEWNNLYLVGEEFWVGFCVVPYVALGYFFFGIYVLQMPSIFLLEKQNWGLLFWFLGATINIAGNILLIPAMGIVGASVSTAFSYFIMMVCIIYKNKNWIPMHYRYSSIVPHLILSILILVVKFYYHSTFLWLLGCGYVIYSVITIYKTHKILFNNVG